MMEKKKEQKEEPQEEKELENLKIQKSDSPRPPQPEKPRVLQTADISPAGENSISNRKTGKGTRGFFRKFRRK